MRAAGSIGLAIILWAAVFVAPGSGAAVLVRVDRAAYGADDIITVTILNEGTTDISLADTQSFCSVVLLEKKGLEGWQPLFNCPQARRPHTSVLPAGERMVVLLPGRGRPLGTALQAGTYRAAVAYLPGRRHFESRMPPGAPVAYSGEFTVN